MGIVKPEDCCALRRALGERTVTLASSSPRRRRILDECGLSYRVRIPTVTEPSPDGVHPRMWTRRWALRKALSVPRNDMAGIILAADTVVVHQGVGLGKPRDARDARAMLLRLSGDTHQVVTGVAVVASDGRGQWRRAAGSVVSDVRLRILTGKEIDAYVASGEPLDKAGGYAIQGRAARFAAVVRGPLDNVVGLPIAGLARVAERVLR